MFITFFIDIASENRGCFVASVNPRSVDPYTLAVLESRFDVVMDCSA